MKFSCILGNPPYMGNLHLKIINTVINHLTEDGVASFIHPARWLQDPLAEYKKGSDKVKFKNIVERLDDVKMIDIKTIHNKFGIIHNSDLMISTLYSKASDKVINLYDGMPQEATDVILSYSKEHNLAQVDEENKVDGWRCQIMDVIPVQNYADSNNTRKRTANLFSMNEKVVFYNGFDEDGVEWMDTRKHTNYGKVSTTPFPHSIKFKTKEEALNFQASCNTKFYCNIMYLLKLDMNTPLKFLPWMEDYSHTWTDEDYCKFFAKYGMSEECQKWMCRDVYDYRIKDFINYIKFDDSKLSESELVEPGQE